VLSRREWIASLLVTAKPSKLQLPVQAETINYMDKTGK
jgi:hypothetical protein